MKTLVPFTGLAALMTAYTLVNPLSAGPVAFNQMVVFGDSLSDTGNLYSRDFNIYPNAPNYTRGKFTDGKDTSPASTAVYTGLWHEDLAAIRGTSVATPSTSGGTDYAFGGGVTGWGTANLGFGDNMGQQVNSYLASHGAHADPTSLFVLWGGSNDLIDAAETAGATPADVARAENAAIRNLENEILFLATSGAKQFLWLDIPDLSKTPEARGLSLAMQGALSAASAQFRSDFGVAEMGLPTLFSDVAIRGIDVYSVFNYITANAAQFGITNTTDAAQGTGANPDTYLFWDGLHPTTTGHALLALYIDSEFSRTTTSSAIDAADFAGSAMASSTPEPATFALAALLLLPVPFLRRRAS